MFGGHIPAGGEVTMASLKEIYCKECGNFRYLHRLKRDIDGLCMDCAYNKKVIEIDYNGLYNAFLLGALTKEEFEEESEKYLEGAETYTSNIVTTLSERIAKLEKELKEQEQFLNHYPDCPAVCDTQRDEWSVWV